MRPGDAACATEAKSNWHVVTLPDGDTVISSQPLLHYAHGSVISALTAEPIKSLDLAAIALLAKFIVLNNENVTFVKFSSNKVIDAYLPWINIFQFLFGKTFQTHVPNSSAQQLARFSACIARPSLLLVTDVVVRAALCGDEDLARRMIASNPNYLLQRGNVTDFSGRKYDNLTPFQATLITGDDKMAEMMKPFFACLENGEAEIQNQVAEIFPNGIEAHEAAQKRKSETEFVPMLYELIKAINNAKSADLQAALSLQDNQSELCKALDTFRGAFTELSHSEKIFNPHYLLTAFKVYANEFGQKKSDLFLRQVIGFVQRFLPATYAQAYAYSIREIVSNRHSCPRSFTGGACPFHPPYPLSDSFTSFALFHFSREEIEELKRILKFIIDTDITMLPEKLWEIFQQDHWDINYKSIKFTTQQFDELEAFLHKGLHFYPFWGLESFARLGFNFVLWDDRGYPGKEWNADENIRLFRIYNEQKTRSIQNLLRRRERNQLTAP